MRRLRILYGVMLLALVLSQVVGCGTEASPTVPEEETAPSPAPEATATSAAEGEPSAAPVQFVGLVRNHPTTLDPAIGTDNPQWKFYIGTYESLITHKAGTMELEPQLAESWQISDDGLVYTFHLRDDAQFHDGTTLDAEDVKVSLDRMKEINQGSAWALADVSEVRIVDDLTVEIVLSTVNTPFLDAVPMFYIVSADAIAEHEEDGDLGQAWLTDHEAGTGPYMLESWTLGEELILTRFEEYWKGWEEGQIDKVILRLVDEPATQAIMMDAGEGNWADSITLEDAEAMAEDPNFNVIFHPSLSLMWFFMDSTSPPLDDVRVRQAIRYAFDYEAMAEDVMLGHANIPEGYMLSLYTDHDPSIPVEHQDVAKAKELMAEAGYSDGGITLDLAYFGPLDWERKGSELLQANLAELGIGLELTGDAWATMMEKAQNPDLKPDIIYWTASGTTSAMDSILSQTFYSKSTHWSNYGYGSADLDRLIEEARSEVDEEKRRELYYQIQWILEEDSPAVNSVIIHEHHVFSSDVSGYTVMPLHTAVVNYYWLRVN